jgi:hypothetical protein
VSPWLALLLLAPVALGLWRLRLRKEPPYLAVAEYWVYLPAPDLPSQEELMTRMVARNPFGKGAASPIGHQEGLLFSDIRLRVSVALRAKNPHAFRPDVASAAETPTPEILAALAASHAFVKIRYVSDVPLIDDRHLQFLPHMAAAYADLGAATAVYDPIIERLWLPKDFASLLREDANARRPELHLRVHWSEESTHAIAQTHGLIKKGLPELKTAPVPLDQRILVTDVLWEAALRIWNDAALPEQLEVESFGDRYQAVLEKPQNRSVLVKILRLHQS